MGQLFDGRAKWIWSGEGIERTYPEPESPYRVRMFRRTFNIEDIDKTSLTVAVSADSRYHLYCNGHLAARGPAKGDVFHQFYDTVDLTRYLQEGRNVLAALVMDFSKVQSWPEKLGAPTSVIPCTGGFLLDGELTVGSKTISLHTCEEWRVNPNFAYDFQNEQMTFGGFIGYFERYFPGRDDPEWKTPGYDDSSWENAAVLYPGVLKKNWRDTESPYGLLSRMIPMLEESPGKLFKNIFLQGGDDPGGKWSALVFNGQQVTVEANQEITLILDAGEEVTGFPELIYTGGSGSEIRLTYAEALRLRWDTPGARLLGRKRDLSTVSVGYADEERGWTYDRRGEIEGFCDIIQAEGEGCRYVPFHWRTFKYVGLTIKTASEPLTLNSIGYTFCAYPYNVTAGFTSSNPKHDYYWDTSIRTFRLCSHETFEDGPYYEQMQYAGDSAITSKIGMLTTGDSRLTRQALYQFDWSRLIEGITQSRYPSRIIQVIPSWSLHWIGMVYDYYMYTRDRKTVGHLIPGIEAVLAWFRRHTDKDGLPSRLPYWNNVDWCPDWDRGQPPGWDTGSTCIISSQYLYYLTKYRYMMEDVFPGQLSPKIIREIDSLPKAIHSAFWSSREGLYTDRPGDDSSLSQYSNAWAVLSGAAPEENYKDILKRFPEDEALSPASFFGLYYVVQALLLMGGDDKVFPAMEVWEEMADFGLSAWAEETTYWRSLCHAWSAHPALLFLEEVLGIKPESPGYTSLLIRPRPMGLTSAKGGIPVPGGRADVAWETGDGKMKVRAAVPEGVTGKLLLPDGSERELRPGENEAECGLS
ncbi:MAG: alpha-L-rhamnosidase C-terminal domain-containing protein [Spirochaetia bacterium]